MQHNAERWITAEICEEQAETELSNLKWAGQKPKLAKKLLKAKADKVTNN